MGSVKVVHFTHNKLANGEHPIYLRITQDRNSRYVKLGISCTKDMWDKKTNMLKQSHPHFREMAILIDLKKSEANKLLLEAEIDNKDQSAEEFKSKLKTSHDKYMTVFKYFDVVIERLKSANRIGYAAVFKSTKGSLKTFRKDMDFKFSDINTGFLNRYDEDFQNRGVQPNSVFVFMRTLKTLVNYARKEGVVKETYNPFKDYSFIKFRRIKTKKRAITKDEMRKIANMAIKPDTPMFRARSYFLFSYYNRGINFVDMAHLTWNDIKNGRLTYIRKKTKGHFSIELLDQSLEILEHYKEKLNSGNDDYIFPILNKEIHTTAVSQDNRIDKVLKNVNAKLKLIATDLKIDEKLTTYVARHTYANVMKRSGVSIANIQESMGHDKEETTRIYLDDFGNDELDEINKAIL